MAKADSSNEGIPEPDKASPKFSVWYLGSSSMDRLYSQTMQPWVMAEVRRKRENIQEVVIEVIGETLHVRSADTNQEGTSSLFEHHLKGLTRFAKLHQDPRCFAYLTRYQLNADFQCHVYLANAEEIIPQLFKAIREASKDIHAKPAAGQSQSGLPTAEGGDQAVPATTTTNIGSSTTASSNNNNSGMEEKNDAIDQNTSLFEVKYLGRAKVGSKRVTADYIDLLADKMIAREEDSMMSRLEEVEEERKKTELKVTEDERQRHASGASVKSLPDTLDSVAADLTTENKLEEQKERLRKNKPSSPRAGTGSLPIPTAGVIDGGSSSTENVVEPTTGDPISLHVDFPSDSDSSRDNLTSPDEQAPEQTDDSQRGSKLPVTMVSSPLADYLTRRRHSSQREESWGTRTAFQEHVQERMRRASGDSLDSVGSICRQHESSRIMVLQIGQRELGLISLDKKITILECKFKDISFVSQGSRKQDLFGIVARESGTNFICYILKCLSDSVVCEIMSTLQMAFTAAYSKRGPQTTASATTTTTAPTSTSTTSIASPPAGTAAPAGSVTTTQHQVCTLCPLHQLHRLCQEINVLSPQAAHDLLVKKVHLLPEKELNEINQRMQLEAPESFEESVEVIMICLHQLCERKQKEHAHISEGNKASRQDINLLEEKHTLFEGLRNKAKRSLTTSFENLLSRGKKKEDLRETFKQRSWTTDSETSWASHDSSTTSTPDASPMPSPLSKDFHHEFPSPPSSPGPLRQRSATLDSPGADPQIGRRRDVNHNNKTSSPMKTMFLLATNTPQHSESLSSSVVSSPLDDPTLLASPRRPSSSWRKAIFNRVCTPQHSLDFGDDGQHSESSQGKLHNTAEIRAMWKKAILETLLLIRMEKENHDIRARQEEGGVPLSRKLEYQELTPCLKEITSVWEQVLSLHDGIEGEEGREVGEDVGKAIPNIKLLEYVKKGVPRTLRGRIWLFLMQQRQMSSTVPDSRCESANYEELLRQLTTHQHAILIDLGRTFPCHPYFSRALGPGQLELFNLLKAYSLLDAEVGYCQGLSFIVGMLLMHMEEISAFHVLKYMMYDLGLRKQFRPNMMALQIKLYQLTRLLHDHYRDVYDHFETHEISPTLYAAPWFLTLFASQFPLGFVARVFDMIFVQGIDAMFKVALMLIGNHRALILQCDSFEGIVDFLKTTLPEMVQVQMERIINQAFELDITKELQAYEVEYHVLSEEMLYSPPQQQQQHHHGHHRSHHTQHHVHHHSKTHSPTASKTHSPTASKARSPSAGKSHSPSAGSVAERPSRLVERRRTSIDLEMIYRMEQQNRALKNQNMDLLEKLQHAQSQQRSFELSVHTHQIEQDKLKSHIGALELERAALLSTVAALRKLVPPDLLGTALPASRADSPAVSRDGSSVPSSTAELNPPADPLGVTAEVKDIVSDVTSRSANQSAHISGSHLGSGGPSLSANPSTKPSPCVSSGADSLGETTKLTGMSFQMSAQAGNKCGSSEAHSRAGDRGTADRDGRNLNCNSENNVRGLGDTSLLPDQTVIPATLQNSVNSALPASSSSSSTNISSSSAAATTTNVRKNVLESPKESRRPIILSGATGGSQAGVSGASQVSLSTSSTAATSASPKQTYMPRSIYNPGGDKPASGGMSIEERRRAAKVRVQQSPIKSDKSAIEK